MPLLALILESWFNADESNNIGKPGQLSLFKQSISNRLSMDEDVHCIRIKGTHAERLLG